MEGTDLIDFTPKETAQRNALTDITNIPSIEPASDNTKQDGGTDNAKAQTNSDLELLELIEEHLSNKVQSHEDMSAPDELFQNQSQESSQDILDQAIPVNNKKSEVTCTIHQTSLRVGHTRESIFKRLQKDQEKDQNQKFVQKIETPKSEVKNNDSLAILYVKRWQSLLIVQKIMKVMAKQQKFDVVRSSKMELLVRKRRTKSIFEQLLFSVRDPIVFQLILDFKQCRASLHRVAGTIGQFKDWIIELEGKVWQKRQLIVTKAQQLSIFLNRQLNPLHQLKQMFMSDPIYIKVASDRRKTDLHKNFKKLMDFRDSLLIQLTQLQLNSEAYLNSVDHFLLKQSGLLASYKQHYKFLEQSYHSKKKQIIQKISIAACLQYLEVQQVHELLAYTQVNNLGKPYQKVMKQLVLVDSFGSPCQKLNCLVESYKMIKECCHQYHQGRVSLEKMDNMLPIIIYVVLYAQATNLFSNLAMLEHYVMDKENCSGNYELERRMLMNLNVALEYIIISWDYPNKS